MVKLKFILQKAARFQCCFFVPAVTSRLNKIDATLLFRFVAVPFLLL